MAMDHFSVDTKYDTSLAISQPVTNIINQIGCISFGNRLVGGFTAVVKTKPDGTILEKKITWDPGSDPKFEGSLRFNADVLLDEMEKALQGSGDHNGSVTVAVKKT